MSWQTDLLSKMHATHSNNNVDALTYWAESEGMPPSDNNWLATTCSCCGGHDVNSVGVKAYPTESDGVEATWLTLQGGAYVNVVKAFRDDAGLAHIWAAVNASPWCGGCQGGKYPVALYDAIGKPPPVPPHGPQPIRLPKPPRVTKSDTWAPKISRVASQFHNTARTAHDHARVIRSIIGK